MSTKQESLTDQGVAAIRDAKSELAASNDALPIPAGNALVGVDDDWGDVGDGDMSPDTITASLSLLPYNAKLDGGFTDPDTGESGLRELVFIWMAKNRSRAWWPEAFGKGDAVPQCRSFNGTKADPNSPDLQNGGDCSTCPHAQWTGDNAPDCREAIEAMVFLPDPHGFGRLARLRFSGLAVAPARAYWRSFNERLPKRPPIAYITKATLEEVDTDNGRFLRPKFERVDELSRSQAQPLIDERDRRVAEWEALVAQDVSTTTKGEANGGPFDEGAAAQTVPASTDADGFSTEEF